MFSPGDLVKFKSTPDRIRLLPDLDKWLGAIWVVRVVYPEYILIRADLELNDVWTLFFAHPDTLEMVIPN
jgi:hypothetical protein